MDQAEPPPAVVAPADHALTKDALTKDGADRITIPVFIPRGPRCPPRLADEIVVCAEDPETFRLRPLSRPDKPGPPLPPTRLKLGENTSLGTELESAGVGGHVSNRVMVRGRIKF